MPETLTFYSDYVCPFCYLGRRSLERYLEETGATDISVEWQPFDLRRGKRRPDGSIDHEVADGKDDAYFEQAKANVERLQERYDVEMAQVLAIDVDSLPAQQASWYVSQTSPDQWWAFDGAIFEALWQDGDDIGDPAVFSALAGDVGLQATEIREAIADPDTRATLEAQFSKAQAAGITGVPTFQYNEYVAQGAVPPAHLERLVDGTTASSVFD